jgi:hypothetical protein
MEFTVKANQQAFKKLQSLEGEWRGTSRDGSKDIALRYLVASKGSVVIEFYRHVYKERGMDDEMVTVYHPNGDDLMLTHYCTLGNQPKMIADLSGASLETLRFRYVSATNLTHHECLRMSGVNFQFHDKDKFTQTWYWFGKKAHVPTQHHSDDYNELADDGPGEDVFTLTRYS